MSGLRRLLVVVLVLAAVLVAVDRLSSYVAAQALASRVRSGAGGSHVGAAVRGFPFLTQLAARRLREVDITAAQLATGGVTAEDARVVATGVAVRSSHDVVADRVAVTALVPYAEIARRAGLASGSLTAAGPGAVSYVRSLTVLGQTVSARVTATVRLEGDLLVVRPTAVEGAGLGGGVGAYGAELALSYRLDALPYGLSVSSVEAAADGVHVAASGTHVRLRG